MKCRFCQAELPDGASFCPVCAKSLLTKKEAVLPNPYKKICIKMAAVILVMAAVVGTALWIRKKPAVYSGGADISYRGWHLLLRNTSTDQYHWKTPQETYSRTLIENTQGAVPLQLYVYDEKNEENIAELFLENLEKTELKAVPQDSGKEMECSRPERNHSFPKAALVSDIVYTTDCGTNDIEWSLFMKNGDTIILHETVEITPLQEKTITWEETPLETTEEIQAAINAVTADDVRVTLVLAPDTVYEGDLQIDNIAVSLTGSRGTVMHGKISLNARKPTLVYIQNISFEGSGAGIEGTEPFFAQECSFTGCSTAILAKNGSWPIVFDCSFTTCQTGIHFNSQEASARSALYSGDSFTDNNIAVLLENVPMPTDLHFEDCLFEKNKTDIDNRADVEVVIE